MIVRPGDWTEKPDTGRHTNKMAMIYKSVMNGKTGNENNEIKMEKKI
jgi:hypothetical protein